MPAGRSNLIDVDCSLVHETERAYLVTTDGDDRIWVPKAVAEFDDGTLTLPRPIAEEKGLV